MRPLPKGRTWKDEAEMYYQLWQSAQRHADKWRQFEILIEAIIDKKSS